MIWNRSEASVMQDFQRMRLLLILHGLFRVCGRFMLLEKGIRVLQLFLRFYIYVPFGFDVSNNLFADHSWYFRNALVRANYKNAQKGIDYTPIYLERFFRNLLLGDQ